MKTKVRQSEATMCSEWGFVAHLSRNFFISSHLVPTISVQNRLWQIFCLRTESAT